MLVPLCCVPSMALQKRAINAQIAKGKVDDSIMRVLSKEIACELMEIIFGNNDNKDVV